ncbi:hypothetical protein JTB14_011613 [Gonioctena quinquepunctata]|nr:hypothetical protein JTB14_011613 [Gonioctena quinquepunctata]
MNDADTIIFLEFYQNEPVLWDPTRKGYKNQDSREAAARIIATAMAIDGFTDVHSTKSGCSSDDVYTPKVRWFKLTDSFLRPHVKGRETQSNLEHPDRKKRIAKNTASENEEPLSPEGMVSQQLLDGDQPTSSQEVQGPSEL